MNMYESTIQAIRQNRIVIIYRGLSPEKCLEVSKILYEAGIRLFEVTMNSEKTEESIKLLSTKMPADTFIGAGTVTEVQQVELAHEAGATYIISPNTNTDVIKRTKELGMVSAPGAMTPTEVELASKAGGDIIKIFPINVLGAKYITQLKGPLDKIEFMPSGGLTFETVQQLFGIGCTAMGLGVQLLGENLIENENWDELKKQAKKFLNA
ncbi:MAG: bifunctional 4-hydroxy-2-oxoglutarate aldolase/2-dehydro-3-deoxy-phosphogluconate aldolase [Balneolaceae bacterium]